MTLVDVLVIFLIVILGYVIIKWALAEMGVAVPEIILVVVALLIIILALTGRISMPELGWIGLAA